MPKAFMPDHPFDNGMLKIRDEKLAGFPRTKKDVLEQLADYYATIEHTDLQVGRILSAIEEAGVSGHTIVVFSSDNGLAMGRHGLMGKQNVYEHSVRVPLIISGPGIPADEKRDHLCYLYDIYPTLCDLAGLPTPQTVQYKSLGQAIQDEGGEHRDQLYFAFMGWQRAIRDNRYKLIEYCVEGDRHTQLFDLQKDPLEIVNLAAKPEHQPTLLSLRDTLRREAERLNDGNTLYAFTDEMGKTFWKTYHQSQQP